MPIKDPVERAAYNKKWEQQNKDKRAAYNKKHYEKNKDTIAAKHKEWREQRPDYDKEYRLTEAGQKTEKITSWKQQGMIADDWDYVYDTYINTICCHNCLKEFKNNYDKHLDHDHATGEIRGVLCRSCNKKDVFAT